MNSRKENISGFGWFTLILIFFGLFVGNFMNLGLGMLIPSIREDLGISLELAGYFSSISFITQVIIAIPVAILSTRLRPKSSITLILVCLTAACLMHAFATGAAMIIIGRILLAVFCGAYSGPISMVKSTWVPTSKIPFINGLQEVGSTLGQVIGTAAVSALIAICSGWKNVMLLLGIVAGVCTVVWLLCYKDNPERPVQLSTDSSILAPLAEALKRKEIWLLALGWPGTTLVWIAFTTYWPTYATEIAGMSISAAGLAIGMIPIGSLVACLVSPTITNAIGYDKAMICPWGILLCVFYFFAMNTASLPILCIFFFLAGFGAFAFVPIAMSVPWKIKGLSAGAIAMGTAFILMIANIGGTLAGVVVNALMNAFSLKTALMICSFSPVLFFATTIFLPELGRKGKNSEG